MTNEEFRHLMNMPKKINSNNTLILPRIGELGKLIEVSSVISSDKFVIDTDRRSTLLLVKSKIQERHLLTQTNMVRLEVNSRPHTNPDGTTVSRNHIHIFKEGYGLRYAYDLESFDATLFKNLRNFVSLFSDFCQYCNIELKGINIQGVL